MPDPPRRIGSNNNWNRNRPLTEYVGGQQVFSSRSHADAYNNRPIKQSKLPNVGNAAAKIGITPLLLQNVLATMEQPKSSFGDMGHSKQAQIEKSLFHLLPDLIQNGVTGRIPLANIPIDMAYYENMPRIDNAYQGRLNSEYSDKNIMDKSLRMYGGEGDGQYFIRDLAGILARPELQSAAKIARTAQLPKGLQGYRGHVAAQSKGGNYGKTYMDLLQDVLTFPIYHAGPTIMAPLLGAARADFGIATGNPEYYNQAKDKNGKPLKQTFGRVLEDSYNNLAPLIKKDLQATGKGLNRAFAPKNTTDPFMGF